MRIGIDCRYILNVNHGELAGVGHYTYFLIKYLLEIDKENQYILFFYNKKIKCEEFEKNNNVKCVYFPGLENIGKIPFFYRHIFIPHILKMYKLDVYHNPANIIPFYYFHKSVITVHDLAIYKNANWFPNGQWFSKRFLIPFSIYKAKKIIAVSENTKDDLIKTFKIKADKISVIHEGVEDYNKFTIEEYKIDTKFKFKDPYFLFIGTLEPRKNLVRLITAFNQFLQKTDNKNFKLVLAGKKGWKYEDIFKTIKNLNLEDKVIYIGYVSLAEKVYLLKKAYCFVFPSLYEGFGLPILEAMNLGLPIITSNVASIPELVIDNALLIEPRDINSIKKALLKIANDNRLRVDLIEKGKGIARNFTWQECAKKTLELYKNLQ
jgi:glycosyltransferase involved in cell wall biosynthesis